MNKPIAKDFDNDAEYFEALAGYWQNHAYEKTVIADECLDRLEELEEVAWDADARPYWVASGELVGEG